MEVKANRVAGTEDDISLLAQPGDFRWTGFEGGELPGRMMFRCPCGCDIIAGITVKPVCKTGWEWDGNLDKPTVTPSIAISVDDSGNHWHGYLTDGVFRSC